MKTTTIALFVTSALLLISILIYGIWIIGQGSQMIDVSNPVTFSRTLIVGTTQPTIIVFALVIFRK